MKDLADEPFVLLGVNSDSDREALKQTLVEEEITWRSWWDHDIQGPIHTQWQIQERPAIHLIDAEGIIRHRNLPPEDVDAAIQNLLDELAHEHKQQPAQGEAEPQADP